jgi:hypothetical protein
MWLRQIAYEEFSAVMWFKASPLVGSYLTTNERIQDADHGEEVGKKHIGSMDGTH